MMQSVEEIIRLRDEAINKLLGEKAELEAEMQTLTEKLSEIREQLARLGYHGPESIQGSAQSASSVSRKRQTRSVVEQSEHTMEQHLAGKKPGIRELVQRLSEGIRGLGEDVQELPRKNYVAYRATSNFCGVVVQASKLWVYIDIPHSGLTDPQRIAEDCSTIGHWATGNTRFAINSLDQLDYAISLIRQSYERNRQSE
jgi:predicted transport protein